MTPRFPTRIYIAVFSLCALLLTLVVVLGFGKVVKRQPQKLAYLEVSRGESLKGLARKLEEASVISDGGLFRWYVQLTGRATKIKSGIYALPEFISIRELARLLTSGATATVKITLPEGRTSWEYFSLLKDKFTLDSLVFDSLVSSPRFAAECSLPAESLEGYIFPETYHFPIEAREADLLKITTTQFRKTIMPELFKGSKMLKRYGLHGVVTLASIVEEEAMVEKEQKTIAGVFYNRLAKGWPLGADPTVRFALRRLTGPLYLSELRRDTPYNTRVRTGLPPGPISNPGYKAIAAAAFPDTTDYMFFVAKDDGSREHFFSVTNRQHDRYKKKRFENQAAQ